MDFYQTKAMLLRKTVVTALTTFLLMQENHKKYKIQVTSTPGSSGSKILMEIGIIIIIILVTLRMLFKLLILLLEISILWIDIKQVIILLSENTVVEKYNTLVMKKKGMGIRYLSLTKQGKKSLLAKLLSLPTFSSGVTLFSLLSSKKFFIFGYNFIILCKIFGRLIDHFAVVLFG